MTNKLIKEGYTLEFTEKIITNFDDINISQHCFWNAFDAWGGEGLAHTHYRKKLNK